MKYKLNIYKDGTDTKRKTKFWRDFSMTPQSFDDIMTQILIDPYGVCVSYICKFSKLTEEEIEKLIILTSGLIYSHNFDTDWDAVKDLCEAKLTQDISVKRNITLIIKGENGTREKIVKECTFKDVNDRVDWKYISRFQSLSPEFINKYHEYLND